MCANTLRKYLQEKKQYYAIENFDCVHLIETLSHFYVDLRKPDGERYKASSLQSIKLPHNRHLKAASHSKSFDKVKDSVFNDSYTNCKAVLEEVKRFEPGDTEHHPVIDEVDREKLHTSMYLSHTTPTGLQTKYSLILNFIFAEEVKKTCTA
ncbi:unnamed protein product [Mytilus coruscus]|uniref:Uncharacterized protein n=1 Tax=Mytilus coruscus TaxID=42192 RepID=A0A6J8ATA6_MYTCO|nr:unnamed protein product [Mytilus coruscus]